MIHQNKRIQPCRSCNLFTLSLLRQFSLQTNKQIDMASYDIYKSRIYLPGAFPCIWTYKIASAVAIAAEKLSTVTTISVTLWRKKTIYKYFQWNTHNHLHTAWFVYKYIKPHLSECFYNLIKWVTWHPSPPFLHFMYFPADLKLYSL